MDSPALAAFLNVHPPNFERSSSCPVDLKDDDDNSLDFSNGCLQATLIKLPPWLISSWIRAVEAEGNDNNTPIQLGSIQLANDGSNRIKLVLSEGKINEGLPKEYDIGEPRRLENCFVFTEAPVQLEIGLRGTRARKIRGNNYGAGRDRDGAAVLNGKNRVGKGKHADAKTAVEGGSLKSPSYSLAAGSERIMPIGPAIHSKTAFYAKVTHEIAAMPTNASEINAYFKSRDLVDKPSRGTKRITIDELRNISSGASNDSVFNKAIAATALGPDSTDGGRSGNKYVRMNETELEQRLFECFTEYRYWSLKDLRAKLKQSEEYLRGVLEKIANYCMQGGPAIYKWTLKEEYVSVIEALKVGKIGM